jgi:hypothetical protein
LGKAVQSEWMGIHGYYPQIEVRAVQFLKESEISTVHVLIK